MEPLKNIYNKKFISKLSKSVKENYPGFDEKGFSKAVLNKEWANMELKARMRHITLCLQKFIPENYPTTLSILKKSIQDFDYGFEIMFFPDFVEVFGLEDYKNSIPALEHFTKYCSSEFAVRPFIIKYPKKMMAQMLKWSKNKNHHVRRLSSEGCRPRLPWAGALPDFKKDPAPILPILEQLKADDSEYVRKSVANNLNDISKDHPELVLKIAKKWIGKNDHTNWIVKHALRTLLKQGNAKALQLFGYAPPKNMSISNFKFKNASVKIGNKLYFSFDLNSTLNKKTKVRLEYGIYYLKKSGQLNRKVFKISEKEITSFPEPVEKYQSFEERTTRKHYKGQHKLSIIVNGEELLIKDFKVI